MTLRLRVREMAQARGFDISPLARSADMQRDTLLKMWRDPYRIPTQATLEKIATVLGLPVSDLIEEVSEEIAKGEQQHMTTPQITDLDENTALPVGDWQTEHEYSVILADESTGTHTMDYSKDGLLSIYFDTTMAEAHAVPEEAKHLNRLKGYVTLNAEGIAALRRLLAKVDAVQG